MRTRNLRFLAAVLAAAPTTALAQSEEDVVDEPQYAEEEYVDDVAEDEAEPAESEPDADAEEEPGDAEDEPTAEPGRRRRWLAPEPSFTLHGYLRTRGEWQDHFALGRTADDSTTATHLQGYPFRYFLPIDRDSTVLGGCRSPAADGDSETGCFRGADRARFANMRMRLAPSVSLSDDVHVHMMIDVFDNMVLGSTPDASAYAYSVSGTELPPGVPLDFFTRTQNPAVAGRNSLGQSIYVRRAWAEISNRDLGELRFGRMANHWGLGMLWNAGAGIDSDYSTDVDRVMVSRQLFGYTFGAAWDFMDEGAIVYPANLNGVPFDGSNNDDIKQFSFFAGRMLTPEEEAERVERGDVALVGGLYYQYRYQNFGYVPLINGNLWGIPSEQLDPAAGGSTARGTFVRRDASSHTLDGWARLRWKDLRIEFEGALVVGEIRNTLAGDAYANDQLRLLQFGFALESEYRLLANKLGLYFDTGFATGDRDVDGLSIREDTVTQDSGSNNDGRASHFTFHPNYRIDQILFRTILGGIGGTYYMRPGISYDLLHTSHGQRLGVRADVVYSRAAQTVQTYGGSPGLGLELDAAIYYRSEDGPDLLDGFWASFHYGILFPLAGLGYRAGEVTNAPSIGKAQTMRVVLGVNF